IGRLEPRLRPIVVPVGGAGPQKCEPALTRIYLTGPIGKRHDNPTAIDRANVPIDQAINQVAIPRVFSADVRELEMSGIDLEGYHRLATAADEAVKCRQFLLLESFEERADDQAPLDDRRVDSRHRLRGGDAGRQDLEGALVRLDRLHEYVRHVPRFE